MITINQLKLLCDEQIKKGNGNKKILISDDEEGNGYHGLFYSFLDDFNQVGSELDEEYKNDNYIILG